MAQQSNVEFGKECACAVFTSPNREEGMGVHFVSRRAAVACFELSLAFKRVS